MKKRDKKPEQRTCIETVFDADGARACGRPIYLGNRCQPHYEAVIRHRPGLGVDSLIWNASIDEDRALREAGDPCGVYFKRSY